MLQRDHSPIHLGSDTVVAELRVNAVGEVDDGRPLGQSIEVSLGRKDKDFLFKEVLLHAVEKLLRVIQLLHPLDELPQPREPASLLHSLALSLVHPVSSDSFLSDAMHLRGSDLNFDPLTSGPDDSRMQRAIHVGLRKRNVVLEPSRNRLPHAVDDAEGLVALAQVFCQDPEGDQVLDFADMFQPATSHLLVDRVEVLSSSSDHDIRQPLVDEALLQDIHHLVGVRLPLLLLRRHHGLELLIHLRLQVPQARILQLYLHPEDAEAVSKRSVQVQRLPRHLLLLLRRHELERPHVVGAIGELDEDHSDVSRHGDDHLAKVLCLLLLFGRELDLPDLCHSIH
mmetsp:Transcript_11000/g.24960  ORF Transcript_11000/g.24960 Transcript_11000/m.24960 type:complete len:340 (-) Transcript_11000:868-1887(-)